MRYPIPDLPLGDWRETELEVEKSRFLTWTCHAPDTASFETLLAKARTRHPNASHHCSAFVAGPPSDDGEPGGTAGRPMFQVLEGAGMGQVGCVVIRYFGGTKLGTGGLARAYSKAVAQALETLPSRDFTQRTPLRMKLGFAGEAEARSWLNEQDIPVEQADYGADGVVLTVGWPSDRDADLSALDSRLKGQLEHLTD